MDNACLVGEEMCVPSGLISYFEGLCVAGARR